MKRTISIFALTVFVLLLSACNNTSINSTATGSSVVTSENSGTTNAQLAADIVNSIVNELEKDDLVVSDDLITALYNYYTWPYYPDENPFFNQELRLLPSFAQGNPPVWEELTFFVKFYCANAGIGTAQNQYLIPTAEFEQIVSQYFPKFQYEHRSSEYLTFTSEGYIPSIHDSHGTVFYRLIDISRTGDIYTAKYDGFMINEGDYGSSLSELKEWPGSGNLIAVMEHAGLQDSSSYKAIRDAMLSLLLKADYRDKLELYDQVTISFQLSGKTDAPFAYLSCERVPPGTFTK